MKLVYCKVLKDHELFEVILGGPVNLLSVSQNKVSGRDSMCRRQTLMALVTFAAPSDVTATNTADCLCEYKHVWKRAFLLGAPGKENCGLHANRFFSFSSAKPYQSLIIP